MRTTTRRALSSALGGGIGAMLAHDVLGFRMLIGLTAGTVFGYFACDGRQALQGFGVAFRTATSWRPNWKRFGLLVGALATVTAGSLCVMTTFVFALGFTPSLLGDPSTRLLNLESSAGLAILLGVGFSLTFVSDVIRDWRQGNDRKVRKTADDAKTAILFANPVVATLGVVALVCYILFQLAMKTPRAIKRLALTGIPGAIIWTFRTAIPGICRFGRAFIRAYFGFVHNNGRLLVAASSLFGGLVGRHFYPTALATVAGMVVGGVVCWMQDELIAVRWLKVAPATK